MFVKNSLRPRAFSILLGLLLLISLLLLLTRLIQSHHVQAYILRRLIGPQQVNVCFSNASVDLWSPIRISVHKVSLRHRDDSAPFITIDRVTLAIPWSHVLNGGPIPQRLTLYRPKMIFATGKGPSEQEGFKRLIGALVDPAVLPSSVTVHKGEIHHPGRPVKLTNLNIALSTEGRKRIISGTGKLCFNKIIVPLNIKGGLGPDAHHDTSVLGRLRIRSNPFALSKGYWSPLLHMKKGLARVEVEIHLSPENALVFSGNIKGEGILFSFLHNKREKTYRLPFVNITGSGRITDKAFHTEEMEVEGPGFRIKTAVGFNPSDMEQGDKCFVKIRAPSMTLEKFKHLFPSPLVSPWVEKELFKALSEGSVTVEMFSFNLSGRTISELTLKLSWEGVNASEELVGHRLQNTSGRLLVNGHKIWIRNLEGWMGKSRFHNVSLRIPDPSSHDLIISMAGEGIFQLADLLKFSRAIITPPRYKEFLAKVESASGALFSRFSGKLLEGGRKFVLSSASLHLDQCRLRLHSWKHDLRITVADIEVADFGRFRFMGKGLWGRSSFKFSGAGATDLSLVGTRVEGPIFPKEILKGIAPQLSDHIKINGPLPAKIALSKSYGRMIYQAELDLNGLKFISDSAELALKTKRQRLLIRGAMGVPGHEGTYHLLLEADEHFVEATLRGFKGKAWEIDLNAQGFPLETVSVSRNGDKVPLSGAMSLEIQAYIPARGIQKISVNGTVFCRDVMLNHKDAPLPITVKELKAAFSDKDVSITSGEVDIAGLPLVLKGRLKGWEDISGEFHLRSRYIDLKRFIGLISAAGSGGGKIIPFSTALKRSSVRIHLHVDSGNYGKIRFGPAKGEISLHRGNLFVKRFRTELSHGELTFTGHLKKGKGKAAFFSGEIKLKDQPLKEIFQSFDVAQPRLQGTLTMDSVFYTQAQELKGLIRGLRGAANFVLTKGKIIKSNFMIKILDFLSLQKIFIKEPPDLSKEGFYYERIGGAVDIQGGVLSSDSIVMKSPVFNAIGRGKLDLNTMEIRGELGAQPFVAIDAIVKRIPIAGYVITGKEGAILVYYFKVRGPLRDPELTYVPLKHLGKGIALFLSRVVLTPVRLFKDIYGFFHNLMRKEAPEPGKIPSK